MRLDEAIVAIDDGRTAEHLEFGPLTVKGGMLNLDCPNCTLGFDIPLAGWRIKRETLNPMEAWSRMKAGKVVRSDACRREFRCLAGLEVKVVGGSEFIPAYDSMDKFMSATDLYEVEDE